MSPAWTTSWPAVSDVARQIALFLTALQFLTRIPVPTIQGFQPDWTARSARYFPVVGALVGAVSAAVLAGASLLWPGPVPAVLAVAAAIALTGAFHEDGLADSADGLGGGQTPARRLEIMKDSRIGTFGALALILSVALRIGALQAMAHALPLAVAALIAANGGGRGAAVLIMRLAPYAGDRDRTKVKPTADGVTGRETFAALAFAALAVAPLAMAALGAAMAAVIAGAACAAFVALLARRLIGGWVGDVLGAAEQAFEIGFLLALAAVLA